MARNRKRRISAEDLYRFRLISGNELSPDGQNVVFSLQRVDKKKQKKYSNLWIIPTTSGEAQQFTYGDQIDVQPKWSPDGSQIAFLSNRADAKQPQIYLIRLAGGEARKLTDLKGTFGSLRWSPDGKRILFEFRKRDEEDIQREKDPKKKELGVVSRHIRRIFFKFDGEGFLPKNRWHIWTVEVGSGAAKQVTDSEVHDEHSPNWSPDGEKIVFLTNRSKDPDLDPYADEVMIIPRTGGRARAVKTPIGSKELPSFSPDGKWISYYGVAGKGNWWRNTRLWLVPVDSKRKARDLTGKYDLNVSSWTINDMGSLPMMSPTWSRDGKRIFFQVAHHGNTVLKAVLLDGRDTVLEDVIDEKGVVGAFQFDRDESAICYFRGTMMHPGNIWLYNRKNGSRRKLTSINDNLLRRIDLGSVEEVWFKGAGRNDLQGWILKPPGFRPTRKYPSILEIHGGPRVQYGHFFMHEFFFLAAHDYVVYFCNPRGGQGYGEQHSKAIWNRWGTADYDDLMVWANYMRKKPYVDPRKMGVTGGSYGGYMTNWIIGHTNRFKAAVTQRSVSNLISMWGSSDGNWIFQDEFGGKPPWKGFSNYWRQSPMRYIGNAKTPTLVIHSENDLRCAIEQGEQVFVALKKLGVPTEMVRFPGEPHGLSRTGRTDRRIERLSHMRRWFDRYLKGEKEAK